MLFVYLYHGDLYSDLWKSHLEQYPVTAHALNFDFLDRMSQNQKMRGE